MQPRWVGSASSGPLNFLWVSQGAAFGRAARLSGLAWGLSYLGGIACFVLTLPFTRGGLGDSVAQHFALAFVVTAAFMLALPLTAITMLPEAAPRRRVGGLATPYRRVWATLHSWRRDREVPKFLLAYYLINDAIVTVIFFTGVMLKTSFGLEVQQILLLSLAFQAIAIPSTVLFGWLGSRWSERGAVYLTLVLWLGALGIVLMAQDTGLELLRSPSRSGSCWAPRNRCCAACSRRWCRQTASPNTSAFTRWSAGPRRRSARCSSALWPGRCPSADRHLTRAACALAGASRASCAAILHYLESTPW